MYLLATRYYDGSIYPSAHHTIDEVRRQIISDIRNCSDSDESSEKAIASIPHLKDRKSLSDFLEGEDERDEIATINAASCEFVIVESV